MAGISSKEDADLEYVEHLSKPYSHLDDLQKRWLSPIGSFLRILRWLGLRINRLAMRLLFRVEGRGMEHLSSSGPFVICPNHTSSLDPAAIVAVLDEKLIIHTRWAGRREAVLRHPFRRLANRLAGTIPVDRDLSALAVASAVLQQNQNLVWFPEGTRTNTGELQEFKPGIGMLLFQKRVPAVPVYIAGAYESWPPSTSFPRRLKKIVVHFGEPLVPDDFIVDQWDEEQAIDELAEELRKRVASLAKN